MGLQVLMEVPSGINSDRLRCGLVEDWRGLG